MSNSQALDKQEDAKSFIQQNKVGVLAMSEKSQVSVYSVQFLSDDRRKNNFKNIQEES